MNLVLGLLFSFTATMARAGEPNESLYSDYLINAQINFDWAGDTKLPLKMVLDDRLQTPEHIYLAASAYTVQLMMESS